MKFLRGKSGISAVEWLAIAVIIVVTVGGTVYGLFQTLQGKFQGINDAL